MHRDLWIKGAAPGKITPASDLKVHVEMTGFKPTRYDVKCIGYIDWTREDRISVRLASSSGRRWIPNPDGTPFARLAPEPSPYRILEEGVHRLPKPEKH